MTKHRSIGRRGAVVAALALAATCVAGATAAEEQTTAGPAFKKVGSWGKIGEGNGQFGNNVFGLAVDRSGNVVVADSDNHRIQIFTSKGGFKRAIRFDPSEVVQDVAADPSGDVWGTALQSNEARRFGGASETLTTPKEARGIAVDAAGNVYVSSVGDEVHTLIRFDKGAGGYTQGKSFGGLQNPSDVEVSADGTVYVAEQSALVVKRFDAQGKLLKTIKAGAAAPLGIGVDPDCNVWLTNIAQRNITKVAPTGKVLATATAGDLQAQDVAVGPTGDVYAADGSTHSIIRFAEDKSKPSTAAVGGVTVSNGVAKVKYTLNGVACPSQLSAVATLSGAVKGKASVKVAAGKSTLLSIPVKGTSGAAQFKIVLKTNGRPTTQTAAVRIG
jgi:streptogramin lyase